MASETFGLVFLTSKMVYINQNIMFTLQIALQMNPAMPLFIWAERGFYLDDFQLIGVFVRIRLLIFSADSSECSSLRIRYSDKAILIFLLLKVIFMLSGIISPLSATIKYQLQTSENPRVLPLI